MLKPTIGIEIHVELKSNSKIFSNSQNDFDREPNKFVNQIDLGYPGVLPRLNKKIIDCALQAALAFNCDISKVMHFDRKNYFYPDLPKGYQITQNLTPIGRNGYVEINDDGVSKKIYLERMHIEEDTCKSIHGSTGTMLNANRAGVPLIEIVTKPCIESSKEAVLYVEKLREILLYLGISDVKIEEGSLRCDVNVSLHEEGKPFGTKTEVKNIGSITNVGLAIEYEIKRQTEILNNNGIIHEETRRFDDKTNTTILMRSKETGNDYRYFPEPDIPYVILTEEWINDIKSKMPVFADTLKEKYKQLNISDNVIKTIISRLDLCQFLESVIDSVNPITASNILTGDILSYLNKKYLNINNTLLTKEKFIKLINYINNNTISSKQSKELIPYLLQTDKDIDILINELGMIQIVDEKELISLINEVLDNNIESIKDYKDGKDRAIKYLMGQIMKYSKDKANPQLVNKLLVEIISKR